MLWIGLAILTAAVVLALVRPLLGSGHRLALSATADVAVYRDQLTEIENDRERGLIGQAEAEAARAEVARRMLHSKTTAPARANETAATQPVSRMVQASLGIVPVASIALYLALGSPGMPGSPLAARQAAPAADAPINDLVGRVEAELKKNPGDVRGWSVVAPVYMRMQRFDDAAYAYSQIIGLKGEAIEPLLGFAEAALMANKGVVNDGVKRASQRALELKPDRVEPKLWLALGKEQAGDTAGALADFKAVAATAPADAPWLQAVKKQIMRLESGAGPQVSSNEPGSSVPEVKQPASGIPAADVIAALPPEEQAKQIAAMVDRLAERLKTDGNDLPGWQRLVRAYQVMGRKDDALAALKTARKQFASDTKALADLDGLAKSLGM